MPPRILTEHALDRMRQRGISREDVESALNKEFRRTPGETGSVWIWGYSTAGATLKVCVATDDESRVITAVRPG